MIDAAREMQEALRGLSLTAQITAVYTSKNEADIIELSLRHMLAEGADLIFVADGCSTDGTQQILTKLHEETGRVWWFNDDRPYHYQVELSHDMMDIAVGMGAEWIIPNDVDQFHYSPDGRTIAEVLRSYQGDHLKLRNWVNLDVERREAGAPSAGPKVVFRYRPGVRIGDGLHGCTLPNPVWDVLETRELHYRSFEHLCRKARERTQTLEPSALARGNGAYHPAFDALSDDEKRLWWEGWCARETIADPIPLRTLP